MRNEIIKKSSRGDGAVCVLGRGLGLVFVGHEQRMPALSATVYLRPFGLSIPQPTGASEG